MLKKSMMFTWGGSVVHSSRVLLSCKIYDCYSFRTHESLKPSVSME